MSESSMPTLFWIDITGLCVSILIAGSLTLLVVGVDPRNQVNRTFGLFTGAIAIWTGAALLLRLSLWLDPVLPTSLFLPNTYMWLVIATVSVPLMCILSLMFAVSYLGRRTRWTDLAIVTGLLLLILLLARSLVSKGAAIAAVRLDANGLIIHEISRVALVATGAFYLYILASIILFWREMHRTGAIYLVLSLLILLLGFVFRSFVFAPFPILSFSNALSATMLAYGVISKQLFNPLRRRTIELNKEMEERKEAEKALKKSEEKYRLIAENTADLISIIDMNLRFTYVSPATMRLRGFTVEEAMGQTLEQVLTPESIRLGLASFEEEMQLEASGTADPNRRRTLEVEEYKKDGSTIWVEVNLSFLRDNDGKPVGILMVSRDMSERKRSRRAIEESEKNYRLLATYHKRLNDISISFTEASGTEDLYNRISESLRFLTGAIATTFSIYNKETRTLKVASLSTDPISSGKAGSIFGPELFEMLMPVSTDVMELMLHQSIGRPKDLRELSFGIIPQEISDAVMDAVGCRQIVALAIGHAEELLGTCVVYLQEDQPVVPDDALKTYINLSGLAITRKQAEEEKQRLEERLTHAEKMEALGTLAGGISHDFNNLLMGIQGYASLTLLDLDASHPHYERMKKIEEHVESGANLTKQLLGVARGGRYDVIPIDMNDVLEKSASMFGRTKKELSIYRKSRKDLWPVEVDRGQMEQVFMNLYVNAWQAMPLGGEISLETENVILTDEQAIPYAITPGKYVKISVTDTGMGMDEKTMKRIFDPFFTTKKMGKGTGLGLATVYGIIKGHKGVIHVDSELGQGTTFTIFLPASEKEVVKEGTAIEAIATGMETILLVDDEKMIIEVSRELLASMGYRVYACGSGQEAIAIYMEKHKEIDLVILDMIMPGISGGETFDRLRKINSGIRILLSSGYSINGQAQEILDRGCNGFIQKPFRLELLSRKVREILG
jgi:PAS domain S-box-containing protein